jgi:hypothetical protein
MAAQPVWLEDDGEDFLLAVAASVPAWQRDALCAEPRFDPDSWFTTTDRSAEAAKAVCRSCLCQSDCLGYALDLGGELPGVWGGTSQTDRKVLRRKGVTGDLVRKYGPYVDAGRELELDLQSFGGLDHNEAAYVAAMRLLDDDDDDDDG